MVSFTGISSRSFKIPLSPGAALVSLDSSTASIGASDTGCFADDEDFNFCSSYTVETVENRINFKIKTSLYIYETILLILYFLILKRRKWAPNIEKTSLWRRFSWVTLRNRLYPLKSPLHRFSRAFKIYKWLRVLNFVIFRQFSGFRALPGKREKRPCDVIRLW